MDKITYYDIRSLLEHTKVNKSVILFLLQKDLLRSILEYTLPSFKEAKIHFEPTYRRNKITGDIRLIKSGLLGHSYRLPGYADRVLLKSKEDIRIARYDTLTYIPGSDHLPLVCVFQLKNLKVAIITWNVASGNPNKLSPDKLEYIDFCRNTSDVLILAFQEVFLTQFQPLLWSKYYDSHLCVRGNTLNRYLGYGIDTYVFWNTNNVAVSKTHSKYQGGFTKGYQLFNLRVVKYIHYEKQKFDLLLTNTHAPFTNSISKYGSFLLRLYNRVSSYHSADVTCVFGDLNSRSLLKIKQNGSEKLIKNIRSSKIIPQHPDEIMRTLNMNLLKWKTFTKKCKQKNI